jgi:hypothetical protein
MTATCFICNRPARYYDRGSNERLCGFHRLGSPYTGAFQSVLTEASRHERIVRGFHGPARAELILAGHDSETNVDLAAWRALGPKPLMDILDGDE